MILSRLYCDRRNRAFWRLCASLTLVALVSVPALGADDPQTFPQMSAEEAQEKYDALIGRLAKGDLKIDYTELRVSYAFTSSYNPYGGRSHDKVTQAFEAANRDDCNEALKLADEVLKAQFVNFGAHIVRSHCFEQMNDKDLEKERAIFQGLTQSVLKSGDGKSAKTAFVVISIDEENFVMAQFGLVKNMQALVNADGHKYDLLTGKSRESGDEQKIYFNIDLLLLGFVRNLGSDRARPGGGGN